MKFGDRVEGSANAKLADQTGMGGGRLPPPPRRRRNETQELTKPIEAALNELPGVWAARNNNGVATTENGWRVHYGLGTGSADIVGTVTVAGCGQCGCQHVSARAFGLEVKWPGKRPSQEQAAWAAAMRRNGWVVETVHSIEEALAVVERVRGGA